MEYNYKLDYLVSISAVVVNNIKTRVSYHLIEIDSKLSNFLVETDDSFQIYYKQQDISIFLADQLQLTMLLSATRYELTIRYRAVQPVKLEHFYKTAGKFLQREGKGIFVTSG